MENGALAEKVRQLLLKRLAYELSVSVTDLPEGLSLGGTCHFIFMLRGHDPHALGGFSASLNFLIDLLGGEGKLLWETPTKELKAEEKEVIN